MRALCVPWPAPCTCWKRAGPPSAPPVTYQCYTTIGSGFFLLTFTPGTDPSVEAWSVTVAAQSTQPSGIPYKLDTF